MIIKQIAQLTLITSLIGEICLANDQQTFIIKHPGKQDVTVEATLPELYQQLGTHPCCQRPLRQSIKAARVELNRLGAQELPLQTSDRQNVAAYHLKRDSDTLIIAACGFPAHKEQMIGDVALFGNYDLLFLDFRWAAEGYCSDQNTIRHPVKRIVLDCIADVQAALAYAQHCGYKTIIGHGICFSAGLFVLTQEQAQLANSRCFDKLILDSCWVSLNAFADNIIKDPYLLWYWGKGGSPVWLKIIMRLFYLPLYGLSYMLLPRTAITDAIVNIKNTPLLFIHGANDALISLDKFEQLWQCVLQTNATALITPYGHSNNHSKNPGVYAYYCNQFITKN